MAQTIDIITSIPGPVGSLSCAGDHARKQDRVCKQQRNAADKTRILSGYREDKIGLRLGQEFQYALRCFGISLNSGESAFADRDRRLDRVIAVSARIDAFGVDDREDAFLLISLDRCRC